MYYISKAHRHKFTRAVKSNPNNCSERYLAALYLLCANRGLYEISETIVQKDTIAFSKKAQKDLSPEQYALYKSAQDIYTGSSYINLQDFANSRVICPQVYRAMVEALQIARGGYKYIGIAAPSNGWQKMEEKGKMENQIKSTIVAYFCPLVATVYPPNEYGDLEVYPNEYDGSFLTAYEEEIGELIDNYDALCDENLARFFDGSSTAAAKLKAVHFGTQEVDGILYGCIQAELMESFTETEEAEFLDWLEGQCADGYGEGLEQRAIKIDEGDLYISFWNSDGEYFLLDEAAFHTYLSSPRMGEME